MSDATNAAACKPMTHEREPRGRPSLYRPEYCEAIRAFFNIEVERVNVVTISDAFGATESIERRVLNTFPTLTRFAESVGVSRATLGRWASGKNKDGTEKYPEFANAFEISRGLQTALLIEGALSGAYDARVAIMTLKNVCGWRDRPEPVEAEATLGATAAALNDIYRAGIAASQCLDTPALELP
ncbi:hypothetical protein SAMN05414139_02920 [Burkholderia sp. D7]|nr:hypothetical protein SAMN05414139_02920 [Burkholderia sp. D7]